MLSARAADESAALIEVISSPVTVKSKGSEEMILTIRRKAGAAPAPAPAAKGSPRAPSPYQVVLTIRAGDMECSDKVEVNWPKPASAATGKTAAAVPPAAATP